MTTWTPALVEARLEEAAWVLKRLPEPRVRGYFSTWPEILRTFGDMVGQEPRPIKLVPSPQAITRMEETLTWTAGLDPIDGKIVWLRAPHALEADLLDRRPEALGRAPALALCPLRHLAPAEWAPR